MRFTARFLAAFLLITGALYAGPAQAATRPSVPRAVKATPADSAVLVAWSAPARTGGAAINRYAVQRWIPAKRTWLTVKSPGARARAATITGLANGTAYRFRVQAHNHRGWSAASAVVAARPAQPAPAKPAPPTAPEAPGAPLHLTPAKVHHPNTSYTVTLTWEAPANSGTAPPTGYRILRSTDQGASFTPVTSVGPGVHTYDDNVPAAGSDWYRYRVVADGTNGSGPPSDVDVDAPAYELTVTETEMSLYHGQSLPLHVSIYPAANGPVMISLESSNPSVAVPMSGTVSIQSGSSTGQVDIQGEYADPGQGTATISVWIGTQQRFVAVTGDGSA